VRALVTGGAGFIGSHVVDALVERGDDVWVLDNLASGRRENVNEGSRLVEADVRDADAVASAFAEAKPETCFHLAAQADVRVSNAEPAFDAEVNVIGTVNVLEAAREHEAKVVFSSTGGAIYGECDGPAGEDSARLPLAPYGTSKLAGEEYLGTWSRLYGAGCKRASGVDAEIVFDPPRPGELSRSVVDPSRAEAVLGWRLATSLDAGLEATWDFVRDAEGEGEAGAN